MHIKIKCDHYSNGKLSLPLLSFLGLQVTNKSSISMNNNLILEGNIIDVEIAIKKKELAKTSRLAIRFRT